MPNNASAVASLVSDPLAFMQRNFVHVNYGSANSGLKQFTLNDDFGRHGKAKLPNDSLIDGYYLEEGDGGAASFQAYWCAYEESTVHSITVGSQADLMFTATMDGCSLGVGSRTDTGDRLV
jgi:hypothetical protein